MWRFIVWLICFIILLIIAYIEYQYCHLKPYYMFMGFDYTPWYIHTVKFLDLVIMFVAVYWPEKYHG